MGSLIVYCSDPLDPRQADQAFSAEASAAESLGLDYVLIDFEALVNEGDGHAAVRRVSEQAEPRAAIYRGWMLKPIQYAHLYNSLAARGINLINDPAAYRHCHYLPDSYAAIEGHTPRSVWVKVAGELPMDSLMVALHPFGAAPLVVKDFVKSRKHEWHEACFIPSAADREAVERVTRKFLELQDDDLNEGLVFREFIEFEPLAVHSKSGMPLTLEFRIFFLCQRAVYSIPYWDEGKYTGVVPPLGAFTATAQKVESQFFTMDVAKRRDGDWLIVELGDGQVAGLPENANPCEFYRALIANWNAKYASSSL